MNHLISFDEMIVKLQAAGATINEMSKVARLLLTLPNSYDPLVTAIQTQADENLSLAFVKIKLLDYETKLRNGKAETSAKVLHAETKSDNYKTRRNKVFKPNLKRKNYHQSYGFKYKRVSKNYDKRCDHCGRKNHEKNDCYYYKNNSKSTECYYGAQNAQMQDRNESFALL